MIEEVQQALRDQQDPERAVHSLRFFKTGPGQYGYGDKFLGIAVPDQRIIAKRYYKRLTMGETIRLLQSPWHEERLTALFVLILKYNKGEPQTKNAIFDVYLDNTAYINNWDLVDSSAHHIVGAWLQDSPYRLKVLQKLARSESLWERRIAVISTFYYIKQGITDEAFVIAKTLLNDSHDLIQKAVGWVLREIGKNVDRALLISFLDEHAATMPRTTLRYAIEHFSKQSRQHYLSLKNQQ